MPKKAFRNELVSNPKAPSKCTALVLKHVNKQIYLFSLLLNGPPKSTATWLKAFKGCITRMSGKQAIICVADFAFFLLQPNDHSLSKILRKGQPKCGLCLLCEIPFHDNGL